MKKFLMAIAAAMIAAYVQPAFATFDTDETPGENEAKICFCHNVNHNPHTICTANIALIQAHIDHVNGEVPGVQDALGPCEEDEPVDEVPTEDSEEPCDEDDRQDEGEEPGEDEEEESPADDEEEETVDEEPADEEEPSEEGDKICFCHNITHNPHTICTANIALIQAHMDMVNGEVPGVLDSLGACEDEEPVDEVPGDDEPCDDDDQDEGEEPSDDDEEEETPTDDEEETPAEEDEDDTVDEETPEADDAEDGEDEAVEGEDLEVLHPEDKVPSFQTTPVGPPLLFEGAGCQLSTTASGNGMGILVILFGTLPVLNVIRRHKRK